MVSRRGRMGGEVTATGKTGRFTVDVTPSADDQSLVITVDVHPGGGQGAPGRLEQPDEPPPLPAFVGMLTTDRPDLAERAKEIVRGTTPGSSAA
ncbi:hypothetical protein SAMN05421773_12742 [Streptomyces aidingensis]|uniref:Uncharacterized protein n=1 Tax=Streptomyces aidingensis TaxID=910347 RepID=A0A1I1V1I9_9ACTN|nr:hypothetical protein SAMN05421773_12742 [Streptomyces aidingensis]